MNRVYSLVRCYVNMKQYYHILLGGAESSKLVCWVSDKRSASWFETKHGSSNQWGYRKYFTVLLGIYLSSVQIHQDGQFTIHEWPLSLFTTKRGRIFIDKDCQAPFHFCYFAFTNYCYFASTNYANMAVAN